MAMGPTIRASRACQAGPSTCSTPAATLIATTTTDANGDYSFADLGPGTYTVQEELQPGWIQTGSRASGHLHGRRDQRSGRDRAGLRQLPARDLRWHGLQRPQWQRHPRSGRSRLAGLDGRAARLERQHRRHDHQRRRWKLFVRESRLRASTRSRRSPRPAGIRPNLSNPSPTRSPRPAVRASRGSNFGNFQLVDVSGNVYNDLNGNGNLDPGEPGLQGWTVNLFNSSGNMVATTTSDANGNYEFDNLFPGTFTISEVLMSGWTQTQPVNPELLLVHDPERSGRDRAELRQLPVGQASAASSTTTSREPASPRRTIPSWQTGRSTCSIRGAAWSPPPRATPVASIPSPA